MKESFTIFKNKNILLISPEFWGKNFVSKHHYAIELSKNNKVYFLNPPSNCFELVEIQENLNLINYKPSIRGLSWFPEILSAYFIKLEIGKIEKFIKNAFDVIWNFDSSRFFNLALLNKKLRIAHIVDWSENFNRNLLCKTSDICFCTSEYLRKDMQKYNSQTFNIGHGYNDSGYILNRSEIQEINDNHSIKAVYVGNLNLKYIDWKLFNDLIRKNPDVGFFFIGPEGKSNLTKSQSLNKQLNDIKKLNNAYFLGEKSGYKIPAYLECFDILLLIYNSDKHKEQLANPHKLLEYLGSGKTIIATWTEEYKDKRDLIEMVSNPSEFLSKFKDVANNLTFYNLKENEKLRKLYSLKNTYKKKIGEIEALINDNYGNGI